MNKYIISDDETSTMLERETTCCGGSHQTIAGALLRSPQWAKWYKHARHNMLRDVDETQTIDCMSDAHFQSFMEFVKNTK